MANLNLNKVILGGRLTSDPELRQTSSGIPACLFTVAINRKGSCDGEQKADFINCQAWRQTAEFLCRYFRKGSSVCIIGSIQTRTYTDKNSQHRTITEVVADEVNFVDSKSENSASVGTNTSISNYAQTYVPEAYKANSSAQTSFELVDQNDDLPF